MYECTSTHTHKLLEYTDTEETVNTVSQTKEIDKRFFNLYLFSLEPSECPSHYLRND